MTTNLGIYILIKGEILIKNKNINSKLVKDLQDVNIEKILFLNSDFNKKFKNLSLKLYNFIGIGQYQTIIKNDNNTELIKSKIAKIQSPISDFDSVNKIKENLNTMTIYITQLLDLSPFTRISLIKDEEYQNATFAVKDRKEITEEKSNIISDQIILDYMRNMFQATYSQASINKSWEWFINDLNNVIIVNLTNLFKKHLEECKIKRIASKWWYSFSISTWISNNNKDRMIKSKTFNVTSKVKILHIGAH